jgi:hypothetical protein
MSVVVNKKMRKRGNNKGRERKIIEGREAERGLSAREREREGER